MVVAILRQPHHSRWTHAPPQTANHGLRQSPFEGSRNRILISYWQHIGNPPSTLRYEIQPGAHYEVHLHEAQDTAEVLNWIVQVDNRSWASAAIFGDFVKTIDDILQLQGRYCESGTM